VPADDEPPFAVAQVDGELFDTARGRRVPYRVYAPIGAQGEVPVIIVSHGGFGSDLGHTRGGHLGTTFAAGGFVAIHLSHLESTTVAAHLDDRPADITFLLDQLDAGAITLPAGFSGDPDLERVGHTGHSFGAYTSHAVAGASYERTHRDPRIDAVAPISPQGAGQFGAYDNGPDDNTWVTVTIPSYNLVGGDEVDTNALGTYLGDGWRLTPFARYPGTADTFLTVIDGQDHSEMWNSGTAAVETFIAQNILRFMDAYVADAPGAQPCAIGSGTPGVAVETTRRAATTGSELNGCTD